MKSKKPVSIGIVNTDDFIIISITMFNKNKWMVIRKDVMKFDMFCIAIILMLNLLIVGLTRNTELQWHEKKIISIINIVMVIKHRKIRKEIIER